MYDFCLAHTEIRLCPFTATELANICLCSWEALACEPPTFEELRPSAEPIPENGQETARSFSTDFRYCHTSLRPCDAHELQNNCGYSNGVRICARTLCKTSLSSMISLRLSITAPASVRVMNGVRMCAQTLYRTLQSSPIPFVLDITAPASQVPSP
jgi:hypothetical protein